MIGALAILSLALLVLGSAFPPTYTDPDEF